MQTRKSGVQTRSPRWSNLIACGVAIAMTAVGQQKASEAPPSAPQRDLVNQYCIACHNQKVKTAGIALDGLDFTKISDNSAVWEKVLRKVSTGEMPPSGMPRPKPPAATAFTSWLENELDSTAA